MPTGAATLAVYTMAIEKISALTYISDFVEAYIKQMGKSTLDYFPLAKEQYMLENPEWNEGKGKTFLVHLREEIMTRGIPASEVYGVMIDMAKRAIKRRAIEDLYQYSFIQGYRAFDSRQDDHYCMMYDVDAYDSVCQTRLAQKTPVLLERRIYTEDFNNLCSKYSNPLSNTADPDSETATMADKDDDFTDNLSKYYSRWGAE